MRAVLVTLVMGFVACGGGKDRDKDGFNEDVDCDDEAESVFPGNAEQCDGVDNDCNGVVDDIAGGQGGGTIVYTDADGDGFGDPATGVDACAPGAGQVADGTDCDDSSAASFPGGSELCDGLDNDCDPATPDAGVAFQEAGGALEDRTVFFAAGTSLEPALFPLDEDGTLHVCEGTWFASLPVTADVAVRGHGAATLDGGFLAPLLVVDGAYDLQVSDVTLANAGPAVLTDVFAKPLFGGAIACESGATVTATGVDVLGSPSYYFAGPVSVVNGCDLSFSGGAVLGGLGSLSAQVYVDGGSARFEQTVFSGGVGGSGSVWVGSYLGSYYPTLQTASSLTCVDCDFVLNEGNAAGAVWAFEDAVVTLEGGSFRTNSAGEAGSILLYDVGGVTADPQVNLVDVYFSGNTAYAVPNDVVVYGTAFSYDYSGTTVSASCSLAGCI